MQVKNVECQLAEMQIGRYVSGEPLSSEALKQLEFHLSRCKSCAKVLVDRRRALKAMLTSGLAAVSTDLRPDNKENLLINALKEKAQASAEVPRQAVAEAHPKTPSARPGWTPASLLGPRAPSTRNYAKPILYSAALALVLLAMGYLTRGTGGLLGQTADQKPLSDNGIKVADTQRSAESTHKVQPAFSVTAGADRTASAASPKPTPAKPAIPHLAKPPTVVAAAHAEKKISSPTSKSTSGVSAAPGRSLRLHRRSRPATHRRFSSVRIRRTYRPRRQVRHAGSSVKVYDESGKPLGG